MTGEPQEMKWMNWTQGFVGQGFVGLPLGPEDGSFWGRKTVWFRADDPFVAFWEMCAFLSWVAKRCPHMVVTEVDEESGTITLSSGFGL